MKKLLTVLALSAVASTALAYPSTYNGIADSGDELWTLTDSNDVMDDSGFTLTFDRGSFNSPDHTFGFYQYDLDNDVITGSLDIFRAGDSVGTTSNVVWDNPAQTAATRYGSIDTSLADMTFGFFFISDGDTYYSQEVLNGGTDYFGMYWETDPFVDANLYVIGNDDGNRHWNYDQMSVSANDVRPIDSITTQNVPEPLPLALMGAGLIGLRLSRKLL
ncbi:MAG: hypothetical protein DRP85_03225 [Candidatus Makaraimicrobium thalassicum]|nr:MAG: hypothetical protein DRP85_03225 [Candidatus Omnitrophota bacterium]